MHCIHNTTRVEKKTKLISFVSATKMADRISANYMEKPQDYYLNSKINVSCSRLISSPNEH